MDQTFEHRRNAAENAQCLDTQAVKWITGLDETHKPKILKEQFPRIANKLALLWPDPVAAEAYLNELLFDDRGNRQGFPIAISLELATLKELIVDQRASRKTVQQTGSLSAFKK